MGLLQAAATQAQDRPKIESVPQIPHSFAVISVAFSPDGRQVLSGGIDHTAKLWDAASGELVRSFAGHSEGVSSVAFSRGGREVLDMNVIAGKPMNETPIFADEMTYVSIRPYWNVPESIALEELIPKVEEDPGYLESNGYEVVNADGEVVQVGNSMLASLIPGGGGAGELARGIEDGALQIRQRPSASNALGLIKFMFPNKHNVYLHDTPSRELFAAERRTFSSGCIRVEDPIGLAVQLLGDQGYDEAKVRAMIDAKKTKQVNLTKPLVIGIVYWTVSVGASGEIRYAPDVYTLDPPLHRALDEPLASRSARADVRR